jgi:hypothetical protein
MFTDLAPALLIGLALLIPPYMVLRIMKKREKYCGDHFKACFWCDRDCTFHALEKVSSQGSALR